MVFSVDMNGCEIWTVKKTEHEELMLLSCGVGEDSWESLDYKEIKQVNANGNQPCIFIGRTDAEAEAPILWPPNGKSGLIGKDPDAGKDWMQEEKGMTKNEMFWWHHRLNGHEFEQTPGDGERQRNLACCSPWGHKALDTTEQFTFFYFSDLKWIYFFSKLMKCKNVYMSEKIFVYIFNLFHHKKNILDNLAYVPQIYFSVYNII